MDLAALRASSRSKADEESTGFLTNEALDRFINEGNRFLYNKVVAACEEYFETEGTTVSVTSGTHKYALQATAQKVVGMEWRPSTSTSENDWKPMQRVERKNRNRNASTGAAPYLYEGYGQFGYFTNKDYIYVVPVPTSGFSMRPWIIPRAEGLVDTTDEPDAPEEFHELIADFAALRILGKSGEDIYKEMKDMFNLQLVTFLETIGHRDHEAPTMVITDPPGY